MFKSDTQFIFIGSQAGIGKTSQKPYQICKFADPNTLENFSLSADPERKFASFSKGEKVHINIQLNDFYGRVQVELVDIRPAAPQGKTA